MATNYKNKIFLRNWEETKHLVKKHDSACPSEDLSRWLEVAGYTKEEFDAICDRWRNKKNLAEVVKQERQVLK